MNQSSNSEITKRIAVVGGGLTGLSAAHRLLELAEENKQSIEITVFESQSEAGGWIGTIDQKDYLIDSGADMFITNKPRGSQSLYASRARRPTHLNESTKPWCSDSQRRATCSRSTWI